MKEKDSPKIFNLTGKRLLTVEEAAFYLGLSPRTIYNAVAPKSKNPFPVKPKRWGKRVLFEVKDLDRFCDQLGAVGRENG